jgi:CPA1 family monovalent cation:H+ antiporter
VAVANYLHVSGLIAVAVAGLYFGNITIKHESIISEKSRLASFGFWEMIAFFANSAAFLYLGLSMNMLSIFQHIPLILLAFMAILSSRAISTYPILILINKYTIEKIPLKFQHVVVLGGMKGALSVALVSTLPEGDFKHILQTITFGVMLFSLLIQYYSLVSYLKKKILSS